MFKKWYKLYLTIEGSDRTILWPYMSRQEAIEKAMTFYPTSASIDHRNRKSKHVIEYCIDEYNHFLIKRFKR